MIPHLVELCLDSVAENFSRHRLLFASSEDFYTLRKLEFLQKKYSPDLISRLRAGEGLAEEFIDILVNKYTKFLDTRWFKKCSVEKLSSKLAEIGCNLEKIFCDPQFVEDEFPGAIRDSMCYLTNLKSFTFHFKCDDWILKNIAKFCRNIEEIDVTFSPISAEGVRYLCRDKNGKLLCTTLKKLCFGGSTSINDSDVKYLLQNLPSLEIISYPNLPFLLYSLYKENLPSLEKVVPYNITTLDLVPCFYISHYRGLYFADIVKVCVSVCPRLKNFSCVLTKEEQFSCLFNLPDLEQLHILSVLDFKEIDSFLMAKGSRLTTLSIQRCTVSVSVLAANCPCLKELILNSTNILCDEDSKPVFSSLSSLTFREFLIRTNSEGIKLMLSSSLIKLESLSFKDSNLYSPEVKVAILKCCELYPIKSITFETCLVKKEFIENLLRICRTLDYLTLYVWFNYRDREDLLDLAKCLPNKPKISIPIPWH